MFLTYLCKEREEKEGERERDKGKKTFGQFPTRSIFFVKKSFLYKRTDDNNTPTDNNYCIITTTFHRYTVTIKRYSMDVKTIVSKLSTFRRQHNCQMRNKGYLEKLSNFNKRVPNTNLSNEYIVKRYYFTADDTFSQN